MSLSLGFTRVVGTAAQVRTPVIVSPLLSDNLTRETSITVVDAHQQDSGTSKWIDFQINHVAGTRCLLVQVFPLNPAPLHGACWAGGKTSPPGDDNKRNQRITTVFTTIGIFNMQCSLLSHLPKRTVHWDMTLLYFVSYKRFLSFVKNRCPEHSSSAVEAFPQPRQLKTSFIKEWDPRQHHNAVLDNLIWSTEFFAYRVGQTVFNPSNLKHYPNRQSYKSSSWESPLTNRQQVHKNNPWKIPTYKAKISFE